MNTMNVTELNDAAMQIILHAGNCRNLLNEAINDTYQENDSVAVDAKLKQAKEEITMAHKVQTDMIQRTIEDEELQTTLLFTHAQDTLMTINSEVIMTNHMIKLYRKLIEKVGTL